MLRAPCILVACLRRPSFPRSCCSLPSVRARCLPRRLLTSRQPPPPPPLRVQPLRGVCHQCSGRGFSTALYLSVQLADVFSVSVCVQSLSAVCPLSALCSVLSSSSACSPPCANCVDIYNRSEISRQAGADVHDQRSFESTNEASGLAIKGGATRVCFAAAAPQQRSVALGSSHAGLSAA